MFAGLFVQFLLVSSAVASPLCPFTHCGSQMKSCALDRQCWATIGCQMSCLPRIATGKFPFLGCVQSCPVEVPSKSLSALTACLFKKKCVPFPMNWGHCKKPNNTKPIGLKILQGLWWNNYGHDKIADCQACQFRSWHPKPNSSQWVYEDNALTVDHRDRYFNYSYPNEWDASQLGPADSVVFYWGKELGLNFKEEWWFLDDTADYKQIYYCAWDLDNPGQEVEGGLVMSKSKKLPERFLPRIAEVYKPYYNISTFCENDNACPASLEFSMVV